MPVTKKTKTDLVNSAIHYLKFRPRSEHEIKSHLTKKTKDQNLIEDTISYLKELKLINDAEFIDWFIKGRLKQLKGPRLISYELALKFKTPRDLVTTAISKISSDDLTRAAQKALDKKLRLFAKYPQNQQKLRAYKHLYQRGFTKETIYAAIDEQGL